MAGIGSSFCFAVACFAKAKVAMAFDTAVGFVSDATFFAAVREFVLSEVLWTGLAFCAGVGSAAGAGADSAMSMMHIDSFFAAAPLLPEATFAACGGSPAILLGNLAAVTAENALSVAVGEALSYHRSRYFSNEKRKGHRSRRSRRNRRSCLSGTPETGGGTLSYGLCSPETP